MIIAVLPELRSLVSCSTFNISIEGSHRCSWSISVDAGTAGATSRISLSDVRVFRQTAPNYPSFLSGLQLLPAGISGCNQSVGGGGGGWGGVGAASTASVLNVQLRSRPDGRHWPSGHRLSSGQFLRPVPSREVFCWRPRQAGAVW